ncbi:MAG: hypothetical protein ACE5R4_12470 [Armatimonadota bacterium]
MLVAGVLLAAQGAGVAQRECAFDLWDWTAPCRDLGRFRLWAEDLRGMGFNLLEISAPWDLLEPEPGSYDLSFIADRLGVAESLGMGLRVRINSYYAGATPEWVECDRWLDFEGNQAQNIPSINDERFWRRFGPLCTAIARRFRGAGIVYNPFIGVHAELKWSDWWTYDESSMARWREAIVAPRPDWLREVVGGAELPERPTVPLGTEGYPDRSPASVAFVAFREQCWRAALGRFVEAIRAGDAEARIGVPLGESYRRQSAGMSNLDYWGLSRGADQVIHSYDFFWHARDEPWYAAASVAAFQGITGLPVSFEFDGPNLQERHGYTDERLLAIGEAALAEGAALKVANYSYSERLPSEWAVLRRLARRAAEAPSSSLPAPKDTVLLFVSKWANYCYRERTEWLHDAQFGAWRMLREHGHHVRVICEDNLPEPELKGYRGLYVAFSPRELIPPTSRSQLERLAAALPSVVEVPSVPPAAESAPPGKGRGPFGEFAVSAEGLPVGLPDLSGLGGRWRVRGRLGERALLLTQGRRVVLGYPLAYCWLNGPDRKAQGEVLGWAVGRTWGGS